MRLDAKLLSQQRGSALVIALTLVFVMLVMVGSVLTVTSTRSQRNVVRIQAEDFRGALDGVVSIGVARVNSTATPPASMSGVIQSGMAKGMNWAVNIKKQNTLYKITAACGDTRFYRTAQAIVEKTPTIPPIPGGLRGTVTSYYGLEMHANLAITGNDHDFGGTLIANNPSSSTYGISTHDVSGNIINNGNLAGANESATGNNATAISEHILSVQDNDKFPNSPGDALGITDAEVTAKAQAGGTYFTSAAQLSTWITSLGSNNAPNRSPIYLAFTGGNGLSPISNIPFDPDKAYIVINPVPAGGAEPPGDLDPPNGIATTGNIHINVKGILIFDDPKHINGGSVVNGAVVSLWGTAGVQDKFGQGGATFKYSTAAIGAALGDALGQTGTPGAAKLCTYIEGPECDQEAYTALQACGVNTSRMPAADGSKSAGWTDP